MMIPAKIKAIREWLVRYRYVGLVLTQPVGCFKFLGDGKVAVISGTKVHIYDRDAPDLAEKIPEPLRQKMGESGWGSPVIDLAVYPSDRPLQHRLEADSEVLADSPLEAATEDLQEILEIPSAASRRR